MNWRYVLYPALVFFVALPLAIIVALFFTAGREDLLYATQSVDASRLNGVEPEAAYAYHLGAEDFVPTPLCTLDPSTAIFQGEPAGISITNTAGRAISSVFSSISASVYADGRDGDFEASDSSQRLQWQKKFFKSGEALYLEACRDRIKSHLTNPDYVVLRVATVFLTAQTANEQPQATMVRFHPVPMTLARCANAPETDPVCRTSMQDIYIVVASIVTQLRAYLIRVEIG